MKYIITLLALAASVLALPALAQDADHHEAAEHADAPRGYVLKPGDGEALGPDRLIKASPRSGTQGGIMVLDQLPAGFSTGIHIHQKGDEFFYVISGDGAATLGDEDAAIGPGDVVFVPEGARHAMSVNADAGMELLFFMDEPGLEGFFREAHALFFSQGKPLGVEDCNDIGAKYNMVCVTPGSR